MALSVEQTLMAEFKAKVEGLVAVGNDPSPPGFIESVLHLFDHQGLDVNAQDVQGATPLGIISRLTLPMIILAAELVKRGANPMLHDMPLGSTLDHQFSSELLTEVISSLVKLESESKGLTDAKGGNFAHYLALRRPDIAADLLEEDGYGHEPRVFSDQVLSAIRPLDGSTIMHELWRLPDEQSSGGWVDVSAVPQRWWITRLLLDKGFDPMLKDSNGVSCAELMEQSIIEGDEPSTDNTWDTIKSQLDSSRLSERAATHKATSGIRRF